LAGKLGLLPRKLLGAVFDAAQASFAAGGEILFDPINVIL
jgi:hypothetical protein